MFYMGIGSNRTGQCAQVVVVKTSFKNVKKQYAVVDFITIPLGLSDNKLTIEISRLYNDNRFIVNQRMFSQDKRPTRTVRAHPRLVACADGGGNDLAAGLRALKIPVESISPRNMAGWEKAGPGKALGNDYAVSPEDLLGNLKKLHAEGRVTMENPRWDLRKTLESKFAGLGGETDEKQFPNQHLDMTEPLMVLALPLWFREQVPYQRSYKA
jgi:hypothetical protein